MFLLFFYVILWFDPFDPLKVAVAFRDFVLAGNGLFALAEILLFLGILSVGLVYVWVKRDLEWIKRVEPQDDVEEQQEHVLPKAA